MLLADQFCPPPSDGNNTLPADLNELYVIGKNYTYVCEEGLVPIGNAVITCLPNKEWSLPPPTCAGKKTFF